jgi:hypothetical protein
VGGAGSSGSIRVAGISEPWRRRGASLSDAACERARDDNSLAESGRLSNQAIVAQLKRRR